METSDGGTTSFADFVTRSETIFSAAVERTWVETDRRVHEPVVRVTLKDVRVVRGFATDRCTPSPRSVQWPAAI